MSPETSTESIAPERVQEDLGHISEDFPWELQAYRLGLEDTGSKHDMVVDMTSDESSLQKNVEFSGRSREGQAYIRGAFGGDFIIAMSNYAYDQDPEAEEDIRTGLEKLVDAKLKTKTNLTPKQRDVIAGNVSEIINTEPIDSLRDYDTRAVKMPPPDRSEAALKRAQETQFSFWQDTGEEEAVAAAEGAEINERSFDSLVDETLVDSVAIEAVLMTELPTDSAEMTDDEKVTAALQIEIADTLRMWQEARNNMKVEETLLETVGVSSLDSYHSQIQTHARNAGAMQGKVSELKLQVQHNEPLTGGDRENMLYPIQRRLVQLRNYTATLELGFDRASSVSRESEVIEIETASSRKESGDNLGEVAADNSGVELSAEERELIELFVADIEQLGDTNVPDRLRDQSEKQFNASDYIAGPARDAIAGIGSEISHAIAKIGVMVRGEGNPAHNRSDLSDAGSSLEKTLGALYELQRTSRY